MPTRLTNEVLKRFSPMDSLKRQNLEVLANKTTIQTLEAGRTLFRLGDAEKRTYFLVSGSLELRDMDGAMIRLEAGSGAAVQPNDANDKTQFTSGSLMNNGTSRLGVRGIEDLGGGLKAGFQFETGLDLDNGNASSSAFWARQANMWLGGNWGTLKLGRQFTPSYLTIEVINASVHHMVIAALQRQEMIPQLQ